MYDQPRGPCFFHGSIQRPRCRGPTAWSLTLWPQWRSLRQLARNAAHRLGGCRLGGKPAFLGLEKNGFEKINSGEKNLPRQNPSKISKNPPMHGYFVDILGKLLTKNCQELTVVWSIYGGFLEWWYPQIIHFNRVSHYKPSIFGYPYYWKHPYMSIHHTIDQVFLYE